MIDAYASLRHFADHLAPIWLALPPAHRGTFFAPREIVRWAKRRTTPFPLALTEGFPDRKPRAPVLVAGFGDHHAVRPRPTVLVNHGAGQSYITRRGAESYSGGPGRERVLLHLEPGPLGAKASAAAGHPRVEVGCPRLDPWHPVPGARVPGKIVAVAIRQHTPPQTCAEQRSIWPEYEAAIPALAERFDLLGHGHPRGWERTETRWAKLGVRFTADSYVVLDQAAALVTCSSSIGWEFASTGRPVIWCNGSAWRREVQHGGRFWGPLPGYVVNEASQLAGAVERALAEPFDPAWWDAVDAVYAHRDGRAAQRAAEAIVSRAGRGVEHGRRGAQEGAPGGPLQSVSQHPAERPAPPAPQDHVAVVLGGRLPEHARPGHAAVAGLARAQPVRHEDARAVDRGQQGGLTVRVALMATLAPDLDLHVASVCVVSRPTSEEAGAGTVQSEGHIRVSPRLD